MTILKASAILLVLASTSLVLFASAPPDEERRAVESACRDYLEAIYDVKPELIERSVHPELRKTGFGRWGDEKEYSVYPMTYEQLHSLASKWNQDGSRANADSPRKIEVFDILDQTATAKLTAAWGIDYFHLAKYDGKWKIINILWQTHPPEAEGSDGD